LICGFIETWLPHLPVHTPKEKEAYLIAAKNYITPSRAVNFKEFAEDWNAGKLFFKKPSVAKGISRKNLHQLSHYYG
jgi:hypothetical protein